MLFSKKILLATAISAVAAFSYAGSASAITFKLTSGITRSNTAEGAFSDFYYDPKTVTIDFNNGKVPTSGFATYSFEHEQSGYNVSSVRADMWAPSGPKGEDNKSNYLAVFTGDAVTINLQKKLNYFGIDWGAISADNTFSFYNGNKLIKSFTSADVEPLAEKFGAKNTQQNQWNGYLHFYSEGNDDNFDKIVISQTSTAGGGFESDNHSFYQGTGRFKGFDPKSTPEPGVVLGMVGVAGILLRQRYKRQIAKNF